jgi:hypothetical protein
MIWSDGPESVSPARVHFEQSPRKKSKGRQQVSTVKLIKYDAACRAIAAAKRVDEVKHIRDVSIAMRAYAKQANNHDLEADAIEIRMRATRRMDQMRQEQKATIGLASGREGKRKALGLPKNLRDRATLFEAGIDKNLAHEGRKLGALSDHEFERAIKTARESVGRVVKDALRDYKSNHAWGKDKAGTGYWNREKHELLLIGTRGDIPCPAPGQQWDSLIMAPRGKHSEKPEVFLQMIEEYFPNLPKIELNRRGSPRPGWGAWGNETEPAKEAAE